MSDRQICIGTTFAAFHSIGSLPLLKEKLNNEAKDGASSVAHPLSILDETQSGQADDRLRAS